MHYAELDDRTLIHRLTLSDGQAFREIYMRYWKPVFEMVCRKLRSGENAAEIVQDLFADLWEKREVTQIEHLDRYLFTAAKYRVINFMQRNLARKGHWDQSLEDISQHIDERTADPLELEDLHHALEHALENLPPKTRDIFRLNRMEDHSVKEIAALMQIPERTVEYHITQSVRKLRDHLKHFVTYLILLSGLF